MSQIHPQARTTPRTRAEIKASASPLGELAERYNITKATARKWKSRESTEDRSHRPHRLCTTLTPAQEALVVELRRLLFCGTGALLSPLSTQQGESIPAVCHAVVLERS